MSADSDPANHSTPETDASDTLGVIGVRVNEHFDYIGVEAPAQLR